MAEGASTLRCRFGREVFAAGGLVTAVLDFGGLGGADAAAADDEEGSVVTVQAQGRLQADARWVKVSPGLFLSSAAFPLDQTVHTPKPPPSVPSTAPCIFVTPREVVPRHKAGYPSVYVQFDLPPDVLPTFKGLSITTIYCITVTVQQRHFFFPFVVTGRGSAAAPYPVKFSSLSVFAADSLPAESVLVPSMAKGGGGADGGDDDDNGDGNEEEEDDDEEHRRIKQVRGHNTDVYSIRHQSHVCTLSLIRSGLHSHLQAGSSLTVRLDFDSVSHPNVEDKRTQACHAVRARLLQCERRADQSRVQERALCCATRSTLHASVCYLHLALPETAPCSFKCPLAEVSYLLEVDFSLDDGDEMDGEAEAEKKEEAEEEEEAEEDEDQQPFSWSLPIEVAPPVSALSSVVECNLCQEAVLESVENWGAV